MGAPVVVALTKLDGSVSTDNGVAACPMPLTAVNVIGPMIVATSGAGPPAPMIESPALRSTDRATSVVPEKTMSFYAANSTRFSAVRTPSESTLSEPPWTSRLSVVPATGRMSVLMRLV